MNDRIPIVMRTFSLPRKPKYRPLNGWERLASLLTHGHKCAICHRTESFVPYWHAISRKQRVCHDCWERNKPWKEIRL